jgi:hypothetical protein
MAQSIPHIATDSDIPNELSIDDRGTQVRLSYARLHLPFALFATLWALPAAGSIGRRLATETLISPGLIVNVSFLIVAYVFYAFSINRAIVTVDEHSVRSSYAPLPWFGGVSLPISEIRRIVVAEAVNPLPAWRTHQPVYNVLAVMEDLREVRIVTTADNNSAEYIRQTLGQFVIPPLSRSHAKLVKAA